ncbi:MAG: biotin--[acetyl-CoA-carboxylase] ligase [Methanobacteriaceae archaeon]|jgi:BirA family biotin operon repressor/biotin-[acetyl-CoA-carboxylase] ligase|nr:biotin--[acetyl-CoA-carboxylase] ligase [Candidatus Methanorudis spinitermitis]
MKKKMSRLLSKNREDFSEKSLDEILKIDEKEMAEAIKEIGLETTEYINTKKIENFLKTKYIGHEILCFDEVESTNTVAKFLAESGSEEGTVVISEVQTKGKGRHGKKWESPTGGVWLSLILRPDISPSKAPLITLATGVAVANTLRNIGADARIKWPNDILINDKKVSGILTESNAKFNTVDYVVVGIGIDSNLNIDILPEELQKDSTTLKNELKTKITETELILKFLNEFETVYGLFKEEKFEDILYDWRRMSQTIGSYVEIKQPLGKFLKGYAVGINNEGALILEESNGNLKKIISGECIIKK